MDRDTILKPLPCNQKWDNMVPTDNGRICLGCGKLVSDFRKKSWLEISKTHENSPIPVCGIYSEEQLKSWGRAISENNSTFYKFVKLSAVLALTQLFPAITQSQTTGIQEQTQTIRKTTSKKTQVSKSSQKYIGGTIVVLNTDTTKKPLQGVSISVFQDTTHLKTTTDSVGRFVIDITNRFYKLPNRITLIISHPDYQTKSIKISKNNIKSLDIIFYEMGVQSKPIPSAKAGGVSYFYAVAPPEENQKRLNKDTDRYKKKWWKFWQKNK